MADLLALLTAAVEHVPGSAAIVATIKAAQPFLGKILNPAAEEVGGLLGDHVKRRRAKNAARTVVEAEKLLAEAGREPQQAPLDIVAPLLDYASLQEESNMAKKWAALLANAADPGALVQVQVGFLEVLRQLVPVDTIILNMLYLHADGSLVTASEVVERHVIDTEVYQRMEKEHQIDFYQTRASLDNIIRLRLCSEGEVVMNLPPLISGFKRNVTTFGFMFMQACIPPKAAPSPPA